jgi:hypothetical protein
VSDEAQVPIRRLAPDGRPIEGRKLRNAVPALLASAGTISAAVLIVGMTARATYPDGRDWPLVVKLPPLLLALVMVVVGCSYARCYVRLGEGRVTIRNPVRRRVVDFDQVEHFEIGRRFPLPYVCILHQRDGRTVVCVAITNDDAPTRQLIRDFNSIV